MDECKGKQFLPGTCSALQSGVHPKVRQKWGAGAGVAARRS